MTLQTTIDFTGVTGRVILPGDADYDAARTVFYGNIDKRPAAVVRAANAADVQRIVTIAREGGYELAIRSGGHSLAGHSTSDGGIVLDLRDMTRIDIEDRERTAWVEAGATALQVTEAATKHDLVLGFGDAGSVGVGGITLGGGVGYLTRKHGLTIDSLTAADVVTADGRLRRVDAERDPDLFWAIRGGGGNFGVVTRFQFRLHDLSHFTGGILILPATAETITGFVAAALAAPDELSTIANIMPAPPMPFIPPEVHGRLVVFGLMAYAGDDAAAERALAPFRALATPLADLVKPSPYPAMYPPEDPSMHPTAVSRTMFLDGVDRERAEAIVHYLSRLDAPMRVAQLRVLGGAMARVPNEATAFGYREVPLIANVAAFYTTAEEREVRRAWVDEFGAALQGDDSRAYVNFIGEANETRVRDAYPAPTWQRLREIKATYDPSNFFALNQNIPPAGSARPSR